MKLHGSIVPHRKDIDELRDTSKKEVRKDVKHQDTSIYEYRNGTVWWSRETNSTILNATAGLGAAQATAPPATPHHKVCHIPPVSAVCVRGVCRLASSGSWPLASCHAW